MSEAKMLVIDDEPEIVNNVRAYLEREGYAIQTAGDDPPRFVTEYFTELSYWRQGSVTIGAYTDRRK